MAGSVPDTAAYSTLSLRLFGTMEADCGDLRIPLKAKKEKWLLALLALKEGHEVNRDWLADTLWPDCEEADALYNLRRTLSNLKNSLGSEGERLQTGAVRSLLLNLENAFCDVALFDRAVKQPEIASLQQAVALYRGPLLHECREEWVHTERIQREQAYLAALDTLAADALTRRLWTESARYARLLIATDPLQETAYRTLMAALAKSGNFSAANQVYRDLRVLLRDQLNTEPDTATKNLFERIRLETRQQVAASNSTEKPALRTKLAHLPSPDAPASVRSTVPRPLTGLIGQDEALKEALSRLRSARLLTLTGAGGVGKTRLALEMAHLVAETYADGVGFVDLAPLTDPELLAQAFAVALNLREEPGTLLQTTLITHLKTQHLLIVLDNCEHLLDACARLVQTLLQSCPGLQILATSRQSLGITGEILWRVPSLGVPLERPLHSEAYRTKQDIAEILEYPAVQLFVERARQTHPEFRPTPANLPLIARICQQLDGIPLALELAAGRVRTLSVEQIAQRLQDRFKLLTGGNRAALPRQQTLRALIEWSYALLDEQEKRLLVCLSLFAGGWTLEAAEQICALQVRGLDGRAGRAESQAPGEEGRDEQKDFQAPGKSVGQRELGLLFPDEVLDLLTSLVDRSLVVMEEQGGAVRYRMLETIRAYARELLETLEEADTLRRRHCDYFQKFAWSTWDMPVGVGVHAIELDYNNLIAALDYALSHSEAGMTALLLAGGLERFWHVRGYIQQATHYFRLVSRHPGLERRSQDMVQVLLSYANMARLSDDYEEAKASFHEALALARDLSLPEIVGDALVGLGRIHILQGEIVFARDLCEQAITLLRSSTGQPWNTFMHLEIANLLTMQGDYESALGYCEEAMQKGREQGLQRIEYEGSNILGMIYLAQRDYVQAEHWFVASLKLYQAIGSKGGVAGVQTGLGEIARRIGDRKRAYAYYREALRLNLEIGFQVGILEALEGIAFLMAEDFLEASVLLLSWSAYTRTKRHLAKQCEEQERLTIALALRLGKGSFETLTARGKQLSLQEAVQIALHE